MEKHALDFIVDTMPGFLGMIQRKTVLDYGCKDEHGSEATFHCPDVLQVLGRGQFLNRIYQQTVGGPDVFFFIAYFPSQRTGDTIHSPKNCIPGAGWAPIESTRISISASSSGALAIQANRYVIAKGLDRELVLYWYQAHGRVVASEYWAKVFLITDAVRTNRSDGALIRIVTRSVKVNRLPPPKLALCNSRIRYFRSLTLTFPVECLAWAISGTMTTLRLKHILCGRSNLNPPQAQATEIRKALKQERWRRSARIF